MEHGTRNTERGTRMNNEIMGDHKGTPLRGFPDNFRDPKSPTFLIPHSSFLKYENKVKINEAGNNFKKLEYLCAEIK